jgi:hypothetical protein
MTSCEWHLGSQTYLWYTSQTVYQRVHVLDDMLKVKSVWSKKRAPDCSREEPLEWPAATACGKFVIYTLTESPSPYWYFRTYEISMSYITFVSIIHIFRSYITIHNTRTKSDSLRNQNFAQEQSHCHCLQKIKNKIRIANPSGRAVQGVGCSAARWLGLRVRILPGKRMLVSCERCLLSGLSDGPISRPGGSYQVWVYHCVMKGNNNSLHLQWLGRRFSTDKTLRSPDQKIQHLEVGGWSRQMRLQKETKLAAWYKPSFCLSTKKIIDWQFIQVR